MSWLPNFSVEVTHINNVLRANPNIAANAANTHTSQLRNMARQVQQMFPRHSLSTIIADLQLSRSMEITIDNILEGRLAPPTRLDFDDDGAFSDYTSSTNSTADGESAGDDNGASDSMHSSMNSADIGYEIERSANIFGNRNELLHDDGYVHKACKCNGWTIRAGPMGIIRMPICVHSILSF